jgi:hypothetical protein
VERIRVQMNTGAMYGNPMLIDAFDANDPAAFAHAIGKPLPEMVLVPKDLIDSVMKAYGDLAHAIQALNATAR